MTIVGLSYRCDFTSYLQTQLYNLSYASYMTVLTNVCNVGQQLLQCNVGWKKVLFHGARVEVTRLYNLTKEGGHPHALPGRRLYKL
jgi:hypothetical protein